MTRQVIWESFHYSYYENQHLFKSSELDKEEAEVEYQDSYELSEKNMYIGQLVNTPWGLFNVDDDMNPFKQFMFWMGHTNFTITEEIAETIEEIPGVEVLHILTRYRFIIAVGKAFVSREVMSHITQTLCGVSDKMVIDNPIDIDEVINRLKKYKRWSIYVFPNGNYDAISLEDDESNLKEFEDSWNLHQQSLEVSGGRLITSDNESNNLNE